MADLLNLPPLTRFRLTGDYVYPTEDDPNGGCCDYADVQVRERILLARIAELVEALEASTEIMARMYGPQAESLPPVVRNRKAIDAARKA